MNKKNLFILIAVLISGAIGYGIGKKQFDEQFEMALQATQAIIAFNHLMRYEELSNCLSRGKYSATAVKLDNSAIDEKDLIKEFLKSFDDPRTTKYIDKRYPNGAASLKTFENKRGNSYSEPTCK